jgi:predicted methyltransferase
MQKSFVEMGLVISKIAVSFNRYEGGGILGNTSQMIILKTTSQSRPLVDDSYKGAIYTGEFRVTVRHYKCKECGNVIKVGASEAFKTIEELKEKGCSNCKSKTFDRLSGIEENNKIE